MKPWNALLVISLLALVDQATLTGSSPGGVPSLTPAQKAVAEAASVRDPEDRVEALRQAIRAGLFAPGRQTRDEVFRYLSENSRWIDLHPYADVFEAFSKADPHHRGPELLDENQLPRLPRAHRLEMYRQAITQGSAKLPHGSTLTREAASSLAAFEGMGELRAVVQEFAGQVESRWRKSFGFESFDSLFELTAGAEDREDAARLAATRLAEISADTVRDRMDQDEGFREAVIRIAGYGCAIDPFSRQRSPGCGRMSEVVQRLGRVAGKGEATREPESSSPPGPAKEPWLDRLRVLVPAS